MLGAEPIPESAEVCFVAGGEFVEHWSGHREQRQRVVAETGTEAANPGMTASLSFAQVTRRTCVYSGIGLSKRLQRAIEGSIANRTVCFSGERFVVEFDVGARSSFKRFSKTQCAD